MKILITGGHISPASALIDELSNHSDIEIVLAGRISEKTVVSKKKITFYQIRAERLLRVLSIESLLHLVRIPLGFIDAWRVLSREKPDKIVSFGSYIAFPVAVVGFLRRIPVYTHEQTIEPGITNHLIAFISKKIFIAFPEAKNRFPRERVVLVGNPIRKSVFNIKSNQDLKKISEAKLRRRVIYITGGSLGSHSINVHIERLLPDLLKKYVVIHQTGSVSRYGDFNRLSQTKNPNYYPKPNFTDDEIGLIFSLADFLITRSGANTVFELIALQKPAVLIPLPWSARSEQLKQAQLLYRAGVGLIFDQSQSSQVLADCIDEMNSDLARFKKQYKKLVHYHNQDAAKNITRELYS